MRVLRQRDHRHLLIDPGHRFQHVTTYEAHMFMQDDDAKHPAALARLVRNGAKVRFFSKALIDVGYKAATETRGKYCVFSH